MHSPNSHLPFESHGQMTGVSHNAAPDHDSTFGMIIGLDPAVKDVLENLGREESYPYRQLYRRWIFEGMMDMRCPILYKDYTAHMIAIGCTIPKPCNFVKLKRGFLGGGQFVGQTGITFNQGTNVGIEQFRQGSPIPISINLRNFQLRNIPRGANPGNTSNSLSVLASTPYAFGFKERPTHFEITPDAVGRMLTIQYQGFNMDDNGFPYVDRNFMDALTAWVDWKQAVRDRNDFFKKGKNIMSEIEILRRAYVRARGYCRMRATQDSMNKADLQQIAARMQDPYVRTTNPYIRTNMANFDLKSVIPMLAPGFWNFQGAGANYFPVW